MTRNSGFFYAFAYLKHKRYLPENFDMNLETNAAEPETSLFADSYDKEVYLDNLTYSRGRTMKAIFMIAAIFLISDLIGSFSAGSNFSNSLFIYIIVFPVIFLGLGFLAKKNPMLSIIIAMILFTGILTINVIAYGGSSLFKGIIMKAVIVFLLLSGFNHARDANTARENLEALG